MYERSERTVFRNRSEHGTAILLHDEHIGADAHREQRDLHSHRIGDIRDVLFEDVHQIEEVRIALLQDPKAIKRFHLFVPAHRHRLHHQSRSPCRVHRTIAVICWGGGEEDV
jgi:hypothetical protein|tara:strand:+ start:187 stop:522 length:336 start_codon:yes stop_codon:yes gene_type:complete